MSSVAPKLVMETCAGPKRRGNRAGATRAAILSAAGRVVGRHGYRGCTIVRVATEAGIASGTVYLHFKSQEMLFQELLPALSENLFSLIGEAVREARDVFDLEDRGLRANFAYLQEHPYLRRVTAEAETFVPDVYDRYFEQMNRRYSRALRRILLGSKAIDSDTEARFDAIAAMLEGARSRLLMRFAWRDGEILPVPEVAIQTYLRFVRHGVGHALDLQSC